MMMEKCSEGIVKELKRQMMMAVPLIVANFLMFALQLISILFVGRISHQELAGASIAISFVNSLAYTVLLGVSSTLDTLCGQSFGAKNHKMVGLYLQRSMVVVTLVSIPLAVVTAFSGRILILLRQVPEISMAAQSFCQLMVPSLFAFGLLQCILKFLQAQKLVVPIMVSSGITALVHCLNCWVLIYNTELGYRGAALSISISYWLNLLLLVVYVRYSVHCKSTWTGFSKEAFQNLSGFLKLGIPSTLMVCFQNWQFELLLLLSGLLKNAALQTSVMSVSQNICSLVFMFHIGLSGAVSTRISNELGAENPKAAKLVVLIASLTSVVEGLIMGAVLIVGRSFWGQAFSTEIEVINAIATMMPWIALSHCIDGFQCVLLGTLRGCGQQKIGAIVCLCTYYLIGIPASNVLGFVLHMGVKGLWIGNICAIFVQDFVLLTITICINWEKQVVNAKHRVQSSVMPVDFDETKNPQNLTFNNIFSSSFIHSGRLVHSSHFIHSDHLVHSSHSISLSVDPEI